MKKLPWLLLISLISVSCDYVGGGVAGAGFDSAKVRDSAENYQGYQHSSVQLVREKVPTSNVQQTFEKMFNGFPKHTLVEQDSDGSFEEFQIKFRKERILVQRGGKLLLEEQLPSAFYMHPLQVGRFQVEDQDLLIFLTKSRATTGLYFLGIYHVTGQRLLTKTIPGGEIWDCELSPKGPIFLCPTQKLHINIGKL